MTSPANRSIPDLVSDAFGQLAKLVGNEFDLARAEMADKFDKAARAGALIGVGAIIVIPALTLILFALAALLVQSGFTPAAGYLIVGVGAAVIAAILIWVGMNRMSGDALRPSMTIDQLQRDKIAAKEMVGP